MVSANIMNIPIDAAKVFTTAYKIFVRNPILAPIKFSKNLSYFPGPLSITNYNYGCQGFNNWN